MFSSKILDLVTAIVVVGLVVFVVDFYTDGGISGFFLGAGRPATEGLGNITPEITPEENVTGGLTVLPGQETGEEETQQEAPPEAEESEETGTNDTGGITGGFYGGGATGGGGTSPPPEEPPEEPQPPEEKYFSLDENPTNKWTDVYGGLTIGGEPAQVGDEVAAFDPDGVLCGFFRVRSEGIYGFLHVYGDDTLTSEDEGAESCDTITFKVYDWSEDVELDATASVSFSWSGNKGRINVDLVA